MIAERLYSDSPCPAPAAMGFTLHETRDEAPRPDRSRALQRTVDYVLDDCLFAAGQAVGTRKAIEYDAVVWLRDHYRVKFLHALETFGDRWLEDRRNVTGVAFMLAERAVRYAGDAASIDVEAIRKASVDVERYCQLHSRRAARDRGLAASDGNVPLIAGYWCITPV